MAHNLYPERRACGGSAYRSIGGRGSVAARREVRARTTSPSIRARASRRHVHPRRQLVGGEPEPDGRAVEVVEELGRVPMTDERSVWQPAEVAGLDPTGA